MIQSFEEELRLNSIKGYYILNYVESRGRRRFITQGACATGVLVASSALGQVDKRNSLDVAGLFTVPVAQQWAGCVHKAAQHLKSRGEINYDFWEDLSPVEYERVFRRVSEGDYDLIVGEIFALEEGARELILDYPDRSYLMGSALGPETSHAYFGVFENYIQDASYLTGMVAAALSKSKVIGMVGGFASRDTNRLMNAFIAGAQEVDSEIYFYVDFLGEWYNPELAREFTLSQIEGDADVVYAERLGVAETAMEQGILTIGNLVDQRMEFPDSMVTSALWHVEPTLHATLNQIKSGTYRTGNFGAFSHMIHDGCSIAPLGYFEYQIDPAILELIALREFEIRTGKFEVAILETVPRSG